MNIPRKIQAQILDSLRNKKSVLLLGPRQTGKSTLSNELNPDLRFNLANEAVFLDFAKDPQFLESEIKIKLNNKGLVFIDEVQRHPRLMNTVQDLIDHNKKLNFILTGSSARKLRRNHANLLPGRVHQYELGSLVSSELNYSFDTSQVLSFGCLPGIVTDKNSSNLKKTLKTYAITYLHEEIKAEALTKNLDGFTRFLFSIAAESTKFLDLSKVSKNIGVPRQTVLRFFEILEDTLIVHRCQAFAKSERRRLVQHPRFFIFDNGVLNALLGNFSLSADRQGFLFENLFFNQLRSSLEASGKEYRISTYRTDGGAEVDFILEFNGEIYALELKTGNLGDQSVRGHKSFIDFVGKKVKPCIIVPDGRHRHLGDVQVLPWQKFLQQLEI
ncbi:MAG: ATP-binding protein [Bdellovibrio sp.]|jgi:predicted AAA+ superfamily ATPase